MIVLGISLTGTCFMKKKKKKVHPPFSQREREGGLFFFFSMKQVPKISITETRLFKYIENLTTKNWKISDKNSDIFHISAQNINCGYLLEPPQRGGSNKYPQSVFEQK